MAETEGITTGELGRAVALIRSDIGTLAAGLAARPDKADLQRVEDSLRAQQLAAERYQELKNTLQDKAIAEVEGWQTWALRLGAPAVVAALAGVIINAGRIGS